MTEPDYQYAFPCDEVAAARDCLLEHGFAMIRQVLDPAMVEVMKAATNEACDAMGRYNEAWASQSCLNFIEASPKAWELARYEPYMRIVRFLRGSDDLCFHRSACIRRKPGEHVVTWHTDASVQKPDGAPQHTGDILNKPKGYLSNSCWFYLTGSRPSHGGLHVIPDSHKDGWQPPAGYSLMNNGKNLHKNGDPDDQPFTGFDMPGMLPLIADPGDMLLFERRTFHGAEANREDHMRLSCAVGFRPRSARIDAPWDWPESAHKMAEQLPDDLRRYLDGYTSIVPDWSPEQQQEPATAR